MVRSIVATSVEVGRGRLDSAVVPEILGQHDRTKAHGSAPARGLTLIEVEYP
jgi:tRNA pseudouridine38-40 synthase